ncbi:MAG: carotenoid oxygenase family protein [Halioglobus sp.]
MKPWPNDPFLQGYYEPLTAECTAPDLIIEGTMPLDLNGTFYRNGPNVQVPPKNDYHFFTGDGMVHAFTFNNGKVSHKNRWARTERFKIEQRTGESLFSGMNPLDTDPEYLDFVLTDKEGVANTSIVLHGDRMLLLEEGHLPFEMDPDTLESHGAWSFYGKLTTTMTAHPKVDPVTGEMLFYAYMATGPFTDDMGLYRVNKEGHMTESHIFKAPYSAMVHDFVVTENYIVFPIMPLTGSMDRAMSGQAPFAWEPEKPTLVGVMPRDGSPEDIRWIEGEPCYVFHFMNGYDKDGVITMDACHFDHAPLFPDMDGNPTEPTHPSLTRWTIDLNAENSKVQMVRIGEPGAEFPVIDPRYAMREYRHGWYTSTDRTIEATIPDGDWVYNAIVHFDVTTNKADTFAFTEGHVSEPMFVPKNADAAEGEGYVLTCVYDLQANTSALCVFDAQKISAGPLARAHVSHRVPVCFHGTWRNADWRNADWRNAG